MHFKENPLNGPIIIEKMLIIFMMKWKQVMSAYSLMAGCDVLKNYV